MLVFFYARIPAEAQNANGAHFSGKMMVSAQEEHDNELYNFILLRLPQRAVVFLLIASTRVMRIVHIVVASKIQL